MTEHPRSYIAPLRVRCAFGDEAADLEPMYVIELKGWQATLRTVDGKARVATLIDAAAFATALDRPDLTRVREHPLVFANVRRRLIGLAVGPPQLPTELRIPANIVRLDEGSAVEIPSGDDSQPSWLLFEADFGRINAHMGSRTHSDWPT